MRACGCAMLKNEPTEKRVGERCFGGREGGENAKEKGQETKQRANG